MLITRRLAEAKLYPTTTPMLESRGSVKCKSAADYTKSSFLLQGGGVLRAKKSPDIPPKPTIQAGLNWLAARSWRSTCIGSAVLSLLIACDRGVLLELHHKNRTFSFVLLTAGSTRNQAPGMGAYLIPQHRNTTLLHRACY